MTAYLHTPSFRTHRATGSTRRPMTAPPRQSQRGVTLVELMVGIFIGLLVVAAAGGALMISRGVSGTVSDASSIQQQAAYAMRVIGLQLRQAGSLYLNPNPANAASENEAMTPVAFEKRADTGGNTFDASVSASTVSGDTGNQSLTAGYRRYKIPVFAGGDEALSRNCLGAPANTSNDQLVESIFSLSSNALLCEGNGATADPIIQNVANFQVRYLVQSANTPGTTLGDPTVQYLQAADVGANWGQVQAVEVCLVLYGNEPIDLPAGTSYTDCDGTTAVDMTTLAAPRARRMHLVFRNVFQLRSQGLIGTVL